jgi:hypothetical protein
MSKAVVPFLVPFD